MAIVRLPLVLLFIVGVCGATISSNLEDKIVSYIGENAYRLNKRFIYSIFGKSSYDLRADSLPILNTLKANGLLNLKLAKPSNIYVTIDTDSSPVFLGYSIHSCLDSMGYTYFYLSGATKNGRSLSVTYTFNSEANIDPSLFASELEGRGYKILNVDKKDTTHWVFKVKLIRPSILGAFSVSSSGTFPLVRVSGMYWLACDAPGVISITVINNKRWRPKIIFFDRDFAPVNMVESREPFSSYSMKVDRDVKFILISDNYNPINLRGGINISFNRSV